MPSDPLASAPPGIPSITPRELLRSSVRCVIDLRSPAEHAEDQVPGAHNVPLFEDEERALIGLLFTQHSPQAAFERGRELARARAVSLAKSIYALAEEAWPQVDPLEVFEALTNAGMAELEAKLRTVPRPDMLDNPLVLHCWRGGLRSRSVAALLRGMGLQRVVVLEGGYRAWRKEMVERIERWTEKPCVVLRGLTGVGKTLVLRAIERERPGWTLDLEGLAGHRSSMLGAVGLEPVSQKRFESRLAQRLAQLSGPVVIMEGESRKVGDRILPARVYQALESGVAIELHAPLEHRLRVLRDDYMADERHLQELASALQRLELRLRLPEEERGLAARLARGEADAVARTLLQHHYDPLYFHAERGKKYAWKQDSSDPLEAGREVIRWIERSYR